jgi:hypothetical protein
MHEGDVRDQVARLEERIETLTASIERCRKIALGAKISVAAGAIWFALLLFWIVSFDATIFVAALAAVLGGIVLLGSNATTWAQTDADLHAAEAARAELIGRIELRVVGEETRTLH